MRGPPVGLASAPSLGPAVMTMTANAMEGDEPEMSVEMAVAEEMASEEESSAATEDIQGEDNPMDSEESDEPLDIPDFIDEIEASNSTGPAAVVLAPVLPPVLLTNLNYDPKCPGLNHRRCKQKGEDDTHKRK